MREDFYCISQSFCKYYKYTKQKSNGLFLSEFDMALDKNLLDVWLERGVVKTQLINICNKWIKLNTNTKQIILRDTLLYSHDVPCIITGNMKNIPHDTKIDVYLSDDYNLKHTMFGVFLSSSKKIVVKDDKFFTTKPNIEYWLNIQNDKFSYKYSILNSNIKAQDFNRIRNKIINKGIETVPKFWNKFLILLDRFNVTLAKLFLTSLIDSGFSSARYFLFKLIEKYDIEDNKLIYKGFYTNFKTTLFYLQLQLISFISFKMHYQTNGKEHELIDGLKALSRRLLKLEITCLYALV